MAELAGLIGKRGARISRGPFRWDMPGARIRPEASQCSKTLEGPSGASPYLDWTSVVSPFGSQTEHRAGGRMQSILPFVQTLLHAKRTTRDKTVHRAITRALREDGN